MLKRFVVAAAAAGVQGGGGGGADGAFGACDSESDSESIPMLYFCVYPSISIRSNSHSDQYNFGD